MNQMKIAVPTRGERVDDHFGHCEFYTLYNIGEKNEVIGKELIASPQGCGCKSNIVDTLHAKGVTVMLAGNMGQGAFNLMGSFGIEVVRGCDGNTDEVVNQFITGTIADNNQSCSNHGHNHNYNHSHSHGHGHKDGHVCNH